MEILYFFLASLPTLAYLFWIIKFYRKYLSFRFKHYIIVIITLALSVLVYISRWEFFSSIFYLREILLVFFFYIQFYLLFKTNLNTSFFVSIRYVFKIYTSLVFTTAIISLIKKSNDSLAMLDNLEIHYLAYGMAMIISILLFVIFTNLVRTKKIKLFFENPHMMQAMSIFQTISVVFLFFLGDGNRHSLSISWFNGVLIFFAVAIEILEFILRIKLTDINNAIELKSNAKYYEQQLSLQLKHYQDFEQYREGISHFKHDHIKIHKAIRQLILENKNDAAISILNKLDEDFSNLTELEGQYSNSYLVNAIIRDYKKRLKAINVSIDCLLMIPLEIKISDIDLIRLFYNALDNAYEYFHSHELITRKIIIESKYVNGWFVISVINSVGHKINNRHSTKTDKDNHGLGVKIFDHIMNRYSGFVAYDNFKFENDLFYRANFHFPFVENKPGQNPSED
ncbi:MAG TPA: GHKL domain-containing protein [Bacilli bacterium]|nr:GHKL domain-containing protein [Bacilli bacterium]